MNNIHFQPLNCTQANSRHTHINLLNKYKKPKGYEETKNELKEICLNYFFINPQFIETSDKCSCISEVSVENQD